MKRLLILAMAAFVLTACGDKVATVTPDEFKQLKKDMKPKEVEKVIGGSMGEGRVMGDTGITEYTLKGESGVEDNSGVTLFMKDDVLNTFIDTGLVTKDEPVKKTKPVEKKPESPEVAVEKALKENSKAEFIKMNGQFIQEPYSVQVEYKGKENLSNGMTTKGMKMAVLEAVYAVKGLKMNISDVGVSVKYPLTDKIGNTTDEYVIKSDFDKETIDKLNDDKYAIDVDNLPDIAKSWWEHPAVQ